MNQVLDFRAVSKKFGQTVVFDHFNLEILQGDFVFIKGKNGSGKSTLFNMAVGYEQPTTGTVAWFNNETDSAFRKRSSLVQSRLLFDTNESFADYLKVVKSSKKYKLSPRLKELVENFDIEKLKNKPIYKLSSGNVRKWQIVANLSFDYDVIFHDEPDTNLDIESVKSYAKFCLNEHKEGKTVILISHDQYLINLLQSEIQTLKLICL